jgi:hypothetical protein
MESDLNKPKDCQQTKRFSIEALSYAYSERSKVKKYPRWHTQPYLLFLALRQQPDLTLSRKELLKEALKLDEKFNSTYGLPKLFHGHVIFFFFFFRNKRVTPIQTFFFSFI